MFKSVEEIVNQLNLSFIGKNKIIKGVQTLKNANEYQLTFYSNPKYIDFLKVTQAGVCLIKEEDAHLVRQEVTKIICKDPYLTYAQTLDLLYQDEYLSEISESAVISKSAQLDENVRIESCVYIGENVKIGKNVRIGHSVTLTNCDIGDNCIIHPGVRIGQDGFGFTMGDKGNIKKIKQLGRIIIGKEVEIGANTSIDRGAIDNTVIGDYTKIDNLVQIGHNVVVGKNCIICAQVGIAGSTVIGDYVMIGGQVGINGHIKIGNMCQIAAKSGIASDLPDNAKVGGFPAINIIDWHKQTVFLRNAIK